MDELGLVTTTKTSSTIASARIVGLPSIFSANATFSERPIHSYGVFSPVFERLSKTHFFTSFDETTLQPNADTSSRKLRWPFLISWSGSGDFARHTTRENWKAGGGEGEGRAYFAPLS